jgi:membrane-associated phospholipid phosphatase
MFVQLIDQSFYIIATVALLTLFDRWYRFAAMWMLVHVLKIFTAERRPDGSDFLSFPSGHSAWAGFIAAAYKHVAVWLWAFSVAASRVILRRHYVHDVITGLVIGGLF